KGTLLPGVWRSFEIRLFSAAVPDAKPRQWVGIIALPICIDQRVMPQNATDFAGYHYFGL
ncbi:hypothetical protein, partial [Desulfatirhabdium butyrativorans]|uniref:hypothetical protein n=1 Tax=Desulfatirhabdium butyrativorans TaxID=340467 RepID=UPI001B7FD637